MPLLRGKGNCLASTPTAGMTRERSQLKPTERRVIGGGKTGRQRQGELGRKSFCPEVRSVSQC